jgi:hypothetical protein
VDLRPPTLKLDVAVSSDFRRSLASAIAWTQVRSIVLDSSTPLERRYRSEPLRPASTLFDGPDIFLHSAGNFDAMRAAVWRVIGEREQRLAQVGVPFPEHDSLSRMMHANGGRLLGYFPDETLTDGASAQQSHRFYDDVDTPPWDLWVDVIPAQLRRRTNVPMLVTWIPPQAVEHADRGVRVNAADCIAFLDI